MLRFPNLLVTKYRDPKTNLESDKNFVDDLNVIDLTLMIPMSPFLVRQLSLFVTMNLYGVHMRVEIDGNTRGREGV
jgi:hypothetical protein